MSRVHSARLRSFDYMEFYGRARMLLHRNRRLLRTAQAVRACFLLGPLHPVLLFLARRRVSTVRSGTAPTSAIHPSERSGAHLDRSLERNGYVMVGLLDRTYLREIVEYHQRSGRVIVQDPHRHCDAVRAVLGDEAVSAAVRRYLGVEPQVWSTQLKWTSPDVTRLHLESTGQIQQFDTHAFHYDVNDVRSLTLFVYLTDVDKDSYPHVIIEGTHRRRRLRDLTRIVVSDDEAERQFQGRIRTITGRRGTAFLEDTTALHKVGEGHKARLILSVNYVVSRPVPPDSW